MKLTLIKIGAARQNLCVHAVHTHAHHPTNPNYARPENLKSRNAQDQDSEKKPSIGLRFPPLVNKKRFFQKALALLAFKTNDGPPPVHPPAQTSAPPWGMRPAAPSCPAAAWTEPNPSSLQAARWTRKLGAALRFLESAPRPAAARQAPRGGEKHLGRPGVFLRSPKKNCRIRLWITCTVELNWALSKV
jgi:hypothetical protein